MIPRLSATVRIVLSLVSLSTSLVLVAAVIGLIPDGTSPATQERMRLCEAMAIHFSTMAKYADVDTMTACYETVVSRNPEILSLGIRTADSDLLLKVGDHEATWNLKAGEKSTETQMVLPIYAGSKNWGTLEVHFHPLVASGFWHLLYRPEFKLAAFMAVATLISYYLYLRKVLRQLNPSRVIPSRVREAFNSLSEGLVILDRQERVVLVNRAFEQATGRSSEQLLGRSVSQIKFVSREDPPTEVSPWHESIVRASQVRGRLVGLDDAAQQEKTFSVSCAPIWDEQGNNRGALASFEDVTRLEKKKQELLELIEHLHVSGEQIKRQNQELEYLATRDSLTGCLNRRAFLEQFETHWNAARRYLYPLSALMIDVDHFKMVNDQHGHAMGDEVLQRVATALLTASRNSDIVCRFGGEEFAVLLPHTDIGRAELVAEKYRAAIESLQFGRLSVTASVGVSALSEQPNDPQELLDQADKCLYFAKRNGRNQVVRWDTMPLDLAGEEASAERTAKADLQLDPSTIPYHAVAALISALAYRDQETAAHSRRVADLCVATAEGLLGLKECYTLEIAALLHDIGKIGVPDSILLKSGPLTPQEWEVMRGHERIGVEIIRASFQLPSLWEIVEHHSTWFGGQAAKLTRPTGSSIPIGARILAIADAYDSMVSDRIYRRGRSRSEAAAELRQYAGTQFDPELVERFVRMLSIRTSEEPQLGATRVSSEAALNIGMQIERLMDVLDGQDAEQIRTLSQRLSATATKYGATEIAAKAAELEAHFQEDYDLLGVMQSAMELLDLCRSTQYSFLNAEP